VGGSLVHAVPAAELPACAVLLDAGFTLVSARRRRTVRAAEFYVGLMTTTLAPDELLVEVRVPAAPLARTGTAIVEVARRHGDFALVGAAALVGLDGGGTCRDARLVFLGVGDVPRPAAAVSGLVGAGPDPGRLHEVGRAAAGELDPPSDLHASSAYRRQVAAVVAAQALADAWRRAAAVPA
jgi:CO/xanthine dehydrogenase FAD-binding subunit